MLELQHYFTTLLSDCQRSVVQFKQYHAGFFFRKEQNLGITCNVTCSFTHLVQTHFLAFHLFSQLLSHCVEDCLQKGKRNIYWISWYHSKQTILFIICQSICQSFKSFHISPFPLGQPKCKCPGGCLRVACGKDDKVLNWWHMTVCKISGNNENE